ncbi:MAG: glutamate 5-kinase [Bacilli bacterium]|nr:glutamate 5-kinase [Bacilli bacterium]
MREINKIKKIVIKIGSSTLLDSKLKLNKEKIKEIASVISKLKETYEVILVTSGAVAVGVSKLELKERPKTINLKQTCAAVGQAGLIQIYEEYFKLYSLKCAQLLLTHDDLEIRSRVTNLKNTLANLLNYNVVPIINENDALAVEEIKMGDNDKLSALVAASISADLLVLVTDIDGLYDKNPNNFSDAKLIPCVDCISDEIYQMAGGSSSKVGSGGMYTKIHAAKMAQDAGCSTLIINGANLENIIKALNKEEIGTWFNGHENNRLQAKAHWLIYNSEPKGAIILDDGAISAVCKKRKSVLAKGIVDVEGNFLAGSVVLIKDKNNKIYARGVISYSSEETRLLKGKASTDFSTILGYKSKEEIIHANDLVIIGEDK